MEYIVHRIRLRDIAERERFESWVRDVDYATCPQLPSVRTFSVQRVSVEPDAPVHYFEIIGVTDRQAFEADMGRDAFHALEAEFGKMAEVVDEIAGERIDPGYVAG
ncbi:RedY protein [Streptomyces sp. JJ36]|uniref:RedY protein n=1 Tax=Streptomyces sp. JJ36 TaxID=2736645 RepID=UPI001F19CBA2|nr:RedY protein [Streptomyces sp. JJ36]MCF6521797.1 RedY protein [Streptomyces sp. JJ36]